MHPIPSELPSQIAESGEPVAHLLDELPEPARFTRVPRPTACCADDFRPGRLDAVTALIGRSCLDRNRR